MVEIIGNQALSAASRVLRLIPERTPGKARLARLAVIPFKRMQSPWIADRFGNRLVVPCLQEPIAIGLFASGIYEPDTLSTILRHLPPDGVFLDVGANVGAISLAVASLRPTGRVVSIEADPRIAAFLRKNVIDNRHENVVVVECVAGAEEGKVRFYPAPQDHFGMGSIGAQFAPSDEELMQRSTDDVLDDLGVAHVDVAKLDIEGAEVSALLGLSRRLTSQHPPKLVFEFVDWAESRISGQQSGDAQRFLVSLGYDLFEIQRGGRLVKLTLPITTGAAMILATRCEL